VLGIIFYSARTRIRKCFSGRKKSEFQKTSGNSSDPKRLNKPPASHHAGAGDSNASEMEATCAATTDEEQDSRAYSFGKQASISITNGRSSIMCLEDGYGRFPEYGYGKFRFSTLGESEPCISPPELAVSDQFDCGTSPDRLSADVFYTAKNPYDPMSSESPYVLGYASRPRSHFRDSDISYASNRSADGIFLTNMSETSL
jgi:hypothetical protein